MRRRDGKGKGVVEAREGESFKRANKRQENDRRAIEAILTQNPNAGVRIGAPLRPANSISASSPCSPRASSQAPCVAPSRAPSTAPSQTQSTAPSQTQSTDLSRASSRAPSAPSRVASPSASSRAPSAPSQQGNHPPQKKKRGPTKLQTFAVQTRQVIHFNDKGQPIGENSKKFSSFLGALGRDMVRITIPEWHHVSTERKEELWKLVKLRFEGLIEEHMENTLQHIGYLWKCSKSRLRTKIKIAHEKGWSDDKINSDLKPEAVDLADWLAFRKEAESSTCIVKSNKYKELRSKNKLAHTMSRKGYARLEEEMRVRSGGVDVTRADLWIEAHKNKKGRPHSDEIARVVEKINECQMRSSTSTSQSINKDPIAQVFGPEHQGRVRGLGFGVTPTSVRATTQSSILVRKLQGDFQRLEEKHEQLAELVRSQQMPPSSRQQQNNPPNLRGKKCKIFDWLCTSKLVDEGEIETDDPMHLVDGIPIGGGAYLVYVERVFEPKCFLVEESKQLDNIGQCSWRNNSMAERSYRGYFYLKQRRVLELEKKRKHRNFKKSEFIIPERDSNA